MSNESDIVIIAVYPVMKPAKKNLDQYVQLVKENCMESWAKGRTQ